MTDKAETENKATLNKKPKANKPSTIARTLSYYWRVTAPQWPMFLVSLLSTLGFVFFLSFANPYVVAQVIDRVSSAPVTPEQVLPVFGPYILMLIGANVFGQLASKLQDYSVWKLEIGAN